jgi:hypothetical protein
MDMLDEIDGMGGRNGQYELYKEIVIRRTLTIQGDSVVLPRINCDEAVRCLRVKVKREGQREWKACGNMVGQHVIMFFNSMSLFGESLFFLMPPLCSSKAGAHLTLRYVRINTGKGELRPRLFPLSRNNESDFFMDQVVEVRGGTVLLEPGTKGADFIGVTFIGDEGTRKVSPVWARRTR